MATKLGVLLSVSSVVILLLTAVVMLVPNLISYKVCVSMTEVMEEMNIARSAVMGVDGQPHIQTTNVPPGTSCDFGMSVSLGIWRCKFSTIAPTVPSDMLGQDVSSSLLGQMSGAVPQGQTGQGVPVESPGGQTGPGILAAPAGQGPSLAALAMTSHSWEGSYKTLGDEVESTLVEIVSMMDTNGVSKIFLGDKAWESIGDLIRTVYIRAEIEMIIALLFSLFAAIITLRNLFGEKQQTDPLLITWAALCHVIQAILLGVALGTFAQGLHQVVTLGEIYRMMTIADQGFGLVVLGYLVVFAAIVVAMTHLWLLACHLRKQSKPRSEVQYSPLTQNQDQDA